MGIPSCARSALLAARRSAGRDPGTAARGWAAAGMEERASARAARAIGRRMGRRAYPDGGMGSRAQGVGALALFIGVAGICVAKSEALSPVSVQWPPAPPGLRSMLTLAVPASAVVLSWGAL